MAYCFVTLALQTFSDSSEFLI
uniref:Uncharacterized protein n=1 Tax=Arundo donax TaxID=35708 RepID=A0A0A8Z947_ARUDO